DETTGNIAITFYDARNDPANTLSEYWGTASLDGGQTFLPNIKLSAGKSLASNDSGFDFGDYQDVSFTNGRFIGAWADDSNSTGDNPNGTSQLDIYIAKVTVANNLPSYDVLTTPGGTYSGLDIGIKGPPPGLTVTIDQAAAQPDPSNNTTIN